MIEIDSVSKSFNEPVLKDISLVIEPGVSYGLLGMNGAGKTTLLRIALGLLRPDRGTVQFDGKNIRQMGRKYYRHVSAVLEDSTNVYPFLTGSQNIAYAAALSGLNRKAAMSRVSRYVDELQLGPHLDRRVEDYSRGMQQKLAIVVALMLKPDVLFLDEPTLGLDVQAKRQVLLFISDLISQEGMSCVLTSHQSDVIQYGTQLVLLLDEHVLVFNGTTRQFMEKYSGGISRYEVAQAEVSNFVAIAFDLSQTLQCMPPSCEDKYECSIVTVDSRLDSQLQKRFMGLLDNSAIRSFSREESDLESVLLKLYARRAQV